MNNHFNLDYIFNAFVLLKTFQAECVCRSLSWIRYNAANQTITTGQNHGEGWGSSDKARLEFTHANGKRSVIYMAVCGSSG